MATSLILYVGQSCGVWCRCVVSLWRPQNREFTPIFHSERSHACGRPNFLLIRLEASQVPHPISLQCGEDKKLSAGKALTWWQTLGMGASESRALCELQPALHLIYKLFLAKNLRNLARGPICPLSSAMVLPLLKALI